MASPRTQRKPSFFWQAILILLPIVLLAIVGALSLRQDRLLAEREAAERAQDIADDLLPRVWAELSGKVNPDGSSRLTFKTDAAGQLVFPPPCDLVPTPQPFNLAELAPEQARLWQEAQQAKTRGLADALKTLRDFIASRPPSNFAAAAHCELGLLLLGTGSAEKASAEFETVRTVFPVVVGESGLPLRTLAEFQLLKLSSRLPATHAKPVGYRVGPDQSQEGNPIPDVKFPPVSLSHFVSSEGFCSNAVWHPTPLTPYFLRVLSELDEDVPDSKPLGIVKRGIRLQRDVTHRLETVQQWELVWAEHEQLRELHRAAQPHLANLPALFFMQTKEANRWLVVRVDESPTNRSFVCRPESQVATALQALIAKTRGIPDYFGIGLELAREKPAWFNRELRTWREVDGFSIRTGGWVTKAYSEELATNVLAFASKATDGAGAMKVNVYLTSPAMLFKLQRARTFWFGALIAVSALAALIGLVATWRAFQRQLRLSDMKSNFVSSVSHELRAPIASVRLLAESLERGKVSEPAKQNEYFRFIGQECRRLSALIENVLDFSRIEQGRKQYEFEPTDLAALARETVKLMQPYAEEKGVKLELGTFNTQHSTSNTQCPDSPSAPDSPNLQPVTCNLELNVDGRAIQQALVNLVDNAIKHSPKGETVMVGLEGRSPKSEVRSADESSIQHPASSIALSVSDHGPGIPASEHARIFERFYRLGSELRRETPGVGIGLSIVRHILEAHGGRVRVESEVGKGSRFTIELPLIEQERTESTEVESRIPALFPPFAPGAAF